jgi:hypothetical protein
MDPVMTNEKGELPLHSLMQELLNPLSLRFHVKYTMTANYPFDGTQRSAS